MTVNTHSRFASTRTPPAVELRLLTTRVRLYLRVLTETLYRSDFQFVFKLARFSTENEVTDCIEGK